MKMPHGPNWDYSKCSHEVRTLYRKVDLGRIYCGRVKGFGAMRKPAIESPESVILGYMLFVSAKYRQFLVDFQPPANMRDYMAMIHQQYFKCAYAAEDGTREAQDESVEGLLMLCLALYQAMGDVR